MPPEGMGVKGVKASVTGTADLPAMRSEAAMANETDLTKENTLPEAKAVDAAASDEVSTHMPTSPTVAAPMVIPLIVKVNAVACIVAPDVVITTDDNDVALHVATRPETLLAPGAMLGVTDCAKKPEG